MSKHCNSVNIDHIITLIVLNKNVDKKSASVPTGTERDDFLSKFAAHH